MTDYLLDRRLATGQNPRQSRLSAQPTQFSQPLWSKQNSPGTAPPCEAASSQKAQMSSMIRSLWHDDRGQDIAEYAVMLAVILVIVVGTIRLVGSNANNVFSSVGSSIQ
jgi:Flp pilus assembly pilin Flp